ncbi:MAG TPA: hypothetical protein VEA15_04055 [Caulobacteraceae bacterium]|nr:hypothetical protein [Caulobacteraceae bacterium]
MQRIRPRVWTAAGLGLLVAGGLAACGDGDIMKEEPTPPPSNTEALAQPGTAEAAAQDAARRDSSLMAGETVDPDAGKAPADQPPPPRRLPDGVGEGGETGEGGNSGPG